MFAQITQRSLSYRTQRNAVLEKMRHVFCLRLEDVALILSPEAPFDYYSLFLEIRRGRLPVRKLRRAVLVSVTDLRAYVARLSTIEERDRYMQTPVAHSQGFHGDRRILELMYRLRNGWDPFQK